MDGQTMLAIGYYTVLSLLAIFLGQMGGVYLPWM